MYVVLVDADKVVSVTHVGEVQLAESFEVPVDDGDGLHLAPPLTGDAAQLEALVGHGLRVRLQLYASSVTQRRCRV